MLCATFWGWTLWTWWTMNDSPFWNHPERKVDVCALSTHCEHVCTLPYFIWTRFGWNKRNRWKSAVKAPETNRHLQLSSASLPRLLCRSNPALLAPCELNSADFPKSWYPPTATSHFWAANTATNHQLLWEALHSLSEIVTVIWGRCHV